MARLDLPKGQYIFFANLSADVTAETLAEFLYTCGLDITADCVSVRTYRSGHASAIVSVPAAATAALINLAINQTLLGGSPVAATVFSPRTEQ